MDGIAAFVVVPKCTTESFFNHGSKAIGNQCLMDLLMAADAADFDNETALFIPLKRDYIDQCVAQVPLRMPGDPGMKTFGTGATSPFLKRTGNEELRPANRSLIDQSLAGISGPGSPESLLTQNHAQVIFMIESYNIHHSPQAGLITDDHTPGF